MARFDCEDNTGQGRLKVYVFIIITLLFYSILLLLDSNIEAWTFKYK